MNFNKWTFIRYDDLLGEDFDKFLSKLVNNNTNSFLYLKVVNKPEYMIITGYSLQSFSNTDSLILGDFIFSNIDLFLFEQYKNKINNADKGKGKDVLYIISFRGWMFTF
jgi:hypothetical protein